MQNEETAEITQILQDWNAGDDNSKGAAYNEKADKRSWEAMSDFFKEVFARPGDAQP